MKGYSSSSIAILVVCALLGHRSSCSPRVPLNPFPFGTIGCLVSDVCDSGEICTNDLLFGSCQNVFSRALSGDIRFHLERGEISRLEREIKKLIKDGFTWRDAYTQCVLQNTLLQFSQGRLFDPKLCEEALGVTSPEVMADMNEEIASVLLKLLENGDLNLDDLEEIAAQDATEENSGLLDSHKRDEIVQIHKYDKSPSQLKRDPSLDALYLTPDSDLSTLSDRLARYYSQQEEPQESEQMAQDFPVFSTDDTSLFNDVMNPEVAGNVKDSDLLLQPELEDKMEDRFLTELQEGESPDDVTQPMSEDNERILEQLLNGSLKPEDLNPEDQRRMQTFIEKLIHVLDESFMPESEPLEPTTQEADSAGDLTPSLLDSDPPAEDVFLTGDADDMDMAAPKDVDQETNTDEASQDLDLDKKSLPKVEPSAGQGLAFEESDMGMNKDENMAQTDSPVTKQRINSNSVFMVLSNGVGSATAAMFVRNLTDVMGYQSDTFGGSEVGPSDVITLFINPFNQEGHDVESIVQDILKSKAAIKARTGIRVENAGIGNYDHGVEVKESNRYVVLTFILVGSIAGVVLAVVTIYLIKRHTRSRQKMAQMAANPDGTEVSKDYQDLCRQRMQGKTSEKPEPLHAASRIGSTSESQVRSPSSRSSTSSWSEEPAATNMDISTGHIVLSYMEDHLKNQNRLDKEWEAVSGYVADPACTKVATDQSNTRKNRFADILPYDHSRVVLSSGANVANSDYVNASFITDHDPRNPAYICTQGPLPHTVADFWQMVWEQGSVVIVMLTKLAENGTSLCHRYWPEEGSDLYHIYEVHLVSEHIWCDDYLVRSFYLKNLQTNETRTVTQFHFLTWPQLAVPASIKTLLDFRRKVNKSFRGRSCPIVVHCSDGCGRSGTYCLIDMVLNKMAKGAKEIDMAATLEHIRDQRMCTVKTKEQFQFSLAAVAEEVHAILKALPQ